MTTFLAQSPLGKLDPPPHVGLMGGPEISVIGKILQTIIAIIVVAGFITAFIVLLVGGIKLMTSGGDEKAIGQARGWIIAAVVGLAIILSTFAIMKLVDILFGTTFTSLGGITIPTP